MAMKRLAGFCLTNAVFWASSGLVGVTAVAQDESVDVTEELPPAEELPDPETEEAATPEEVPAPETAAPAGEQTEAPAPEEQAPTARPTSGEPAKSAEDTIEPAPEEEHPGRRERVVGSYRLHIGAAKPKFESDLKYYDELYGDTIFYPQLGVDYYFFDWYATLGFGTNIGYYRVGGKAANRDASGGIVKDPESQLELTLIPVKAFLTAQISPIPGRWLVLSGWFGVEGLYVQETRHPTTAAGTTKSTASSSGPSTYVNSGWNQGAVVGLAASIRLDALDRTSVGSLDAIGLRSVYMTPFAETVTTTNKKMGPFGRSTFGLLFTFESKN